MFQIVTVNGQQNLQAVTDLGPGTYTVRVQSSSTYLISEVDNLNGANGPFALQVSFATDSKDLPSSAFEQAAANAGLITLDSNATGSWQPAVSVNAAVPGTLAQTNYPKAYTYANLPAGSYPASFWSSITATNPTATVSDVVGSSGIDTNTNTATDPNANTAWAVVDVQANSTSLPQTSEYAVGVQVFTEQVITITVTQ